MQEDSKPRDWADRGTDKGGKPKAPIPGGSNDNGAPRSSVIKEGVHVKGTAGRTTYPNLGK